MKWTTRAQLHLDRTASAWLIRRFVDADAEFEFVGWDVAPDPEDTRSFGMPGAAHGGHDEHGPGFTKILRAHGLQDDGALVRLGACVGAGVRHALGLPRTEGDDATHGLGVALDTIGVGLSILHEDDLDHLDAATPLYDSLHASLQLPPADAMDLPLTQPERVAYLRSLVTL